MKLTEEMTLKPDKYEVARNEHVSLAQHAYQISKQIKDQDTLAIAAELLVSIKAKRKAWKELIAPAVKGALDAHRKIKAVENQIDLPLAQAENEILKPAIGSFRDEEEKARRKQEEAIKVNTGMDVVMADKTKVAGISYKTNHYAEVTDMQAFILAIAEGIIPIGAISPNMPLLNAMAKNLKSGLNWPGVTVKTEQVVSAKSNI